MNVGRYDTPTVQIRKVSFAVLLKNPA
jgi:hypothetical protein